MLIGIGKLMIYFSTPFKQAANGLELFKLLAWLSVISNFIRLRCLLVGCAVHALNLPAISLFLYWRYAGAVIGIYLFKDRSKFLSIRWNKTGYLNLLRESLPQTGVVLITSALSAVRLDIYRFYPSAVKLAK